MTKKQIRVRGGITSSKADPNKEGREAMTYTPRQLAERIASRLDSATYDLGKERETRVAILEAEIAAILRMAEATIRDQLSRVRVSDG